MSEHHQAAPGDQSYPVLPLRDIVVFPHMIVPLFVGRDKSVRALEAVMREDREILLATQRDAGEDEPGADDIHEVGVIANVLQLLKLPDGTVKVLVEGARRARITSFIRDDDYFEALAEPIEEIYGDEAGLEALARTIAAVGLAQNFSAMKALATTGIQKGHMALHAQNIAMMAGAMFCWGMPSPGCRMPTRRLLRASVIR